MQGHQSEQVVTPATGRRFGWLAVPLAGAAVLLLVGVAGWLGDWPLGVDSTVYRSAGAALLHGDPLYDALVLPGQPPWARLPFTYPPPAALLFVPLTAVPTQVGWGLLAAASLLSLVVVVRVCVARLPRRPAWLTGRVIVILPVLMLGLEPVWRTTAIGQVNIILMALVVVDVLVLGTATGRARKFGGVLIGVASAAKLTPLIFVPHLLLTGRRADAARAVGMFVALQGLMFLLNTHDFTRFWGHAVTDPARTGPTHEAGNQSLHGLILRLSDLASWSLAAAIAVSAVLAVPAWWLVRRLHLRGRTVPALLVSAFLGLVVSPVSWSHHWVWAVPLVVVLLARLPAGRVRVATLAPLPTVVVIYASCVPLIMRRDRDAGLDWGVPEFLIGSVYLLVPLVAGAVVLSRELRTSR